MSVAHSPQSKPLILVVDDEPIVLRMATAVLGNAGYEALVAENGVQGLYLFEQYADQIVLVLADIIMPELHGPDLANRILGIKPDAKVLLMSGYSNSVIENEARKRFPFIRKPFLPQDLVSKIRSMLVQPAASAG